MPELAAVRSAPRAHVAIDGGARERHDRGHAAQQHLVTGREHARGATWTPRACGKLITGARQGAYYLSREGKESVVEIMA